MVRARERAGDPMTLRIWIPCRCGVLVEVEIYRHGQRVTCATCEKEI
jgi:hypothetical protein